ASGEFQQDYNGRESHRFRLPQPVYNELRRICSGSAYGIFILLLAGIDCLLYKYSGNEDIIIGAPVFKQTGTANYFNNILALRNTIAGTMTFKELMLRVKNTVSEANENMNYPFTEITDLLKQPEPGNGSPLFDVLIALENIHETPVLAEQKCAATFSFEMTGSFMDCEMNYITASFDEKAIHRLRRHLLNVFDHVSRNPTGKLSGVDFLSPEEKQQVLLDFNNTATAYPHRKTIPQLFEEQVEKNPDNTAAVGMEHSRGYGGILHLTYLQLNREANQLANFLKNNGITPGDIAGIMLERSLDMVIGILAVLKAGGACFLIAPEVPVNRAATMLEDCRAAILLTKKEAIKNKSFVHLKGLRSIGIKPHITASRPQVTDLDGLPVPDRSLVDYKKYDPFIGDPSIKNTYIT
ncbi:MAG: AMP-binding protein, partial [bacterium]|nr:AMP-binding protein [bacterium]